MAKIYLPCDDGIAVWSLERLVEERHEESGASLCPGPESL